MIKQRNQAEAAALSIMSVPDGQKYFEVEVPKGMTQDRFRKKIIYHLTRRNFTPPYMASSSRGNKLTLLAVMTK